MDATNTKTNQPGNSIVDRKIQQLRKDTLNSNHGRIEFPKNQKSFNAVERHNKRLKYIDPYLTLLPDTQLHPPRQTFGVFHLLHKHQT